MTTKRKEQGLSLTDIGPVYEDVPVTAEKAVRVSGISAKGIFTIFQRFPQVMEWFKGGRIDLQGLIAEMPDAIAAIIAAGCNQPGDDEAEEIAGSYAAETQLDITEAIGRLTFKNGFGPFVKRIVAMANAAQSVNYGRVPGMNLPQGSNPVSPQATTAPPSGTTPQGKSPPTASLPAGDASAT